MSIDTSAIQQFIETRRAELQAEAANMRARLLQIDDEIDGLDRAERAAKGLRPYHQRGPQPGMISKGTIMYRILEILEGPQEPKHVMEILHFINSTRNPPLKRTSLSPQLSRLRQGGFVRLEDGLWSIARADWQQSIKNTEAKA